MRSFAEAELASSARERDEEERFDRALMFDRLAQLGLTGIEGARLILYQAAWRASQGRSYSKKSPMAKLVASEAAMDVTTKAVQVHGGYGYTREYPVERMMRDAKITEIYAGTSEVQRIVIGAALTRG